MKNAAQYAAFRRYKSILSICFQTETDVRYAGQDFTFHHVPHAHMQRIALLQVDVWKRKTVLVNTNSVTKHVSVVVIQAAVKRVNAHTMAGFYSLADLQAKACKRISRRYPQAYLSDVTP